MYYKGAQLDRSIVLDVPCPPSRVVDRAAACVNTT